jgi:uridine monophosphate synthetase
MLVPLSRPLSRAADPRAEAARLRDAMRGVRGKLDAGKQAALTRPRAALADILLGAGCVRFGSFTLKSGNQSPIYLDLRLLASSPRLLAQAAASYLPLLHDLAFDRLAAVPYAGLPIGAAVALQGGWSLIYPRKEVKAYGTKAPVEGIYAKGETAVVIDDVATTGGSKVEAVERLQAAGLIVRDVVVLIDREAGARQELVRRGIRLHAAFTLRQLLDHWELTGAVEASQIRAVREFLDGGAA